jgi:hypothetical protein
LPGVYAYVTSDELKANLLSTYFTLRLGIVLLSAALPVVLYAGGRWAGVEGLPGSMSAYYGEHGGAMRDWFVGILWAVGAFLYLYKGFSTLENVLLNVAGLAAILVAMIPCHCWRGAAADGHVLHAIAAVTFFAAMSGVCLFCANETTSLLPTPEQRRAFRRQYRVIGVVLVLSPAAAIAASYALLVGPSYRFFIEAFAVWTFAAYWLTKSAEFRITAAEKKAVEGQLETLPGVGAAPARP